MARAPLSALVAKYKRDMVGVAARSSADLATRVVTRTPVDTGAARLAWTPSLNGIDDSNSGGSIAGTANAMQSGDSFSLANSLSYIRVLEYDSHSAQAPNGMLRLSVAEWQAIVRAAVARLA